MPETILDRVVRSVRRRLEEVAPRPDLEDAALEAAQSRVDRGLRSLAAGLRREGPTIIAECKRASPSAGLLRSDFDPVALARAYQAGGAAAISVVTEPDHFQGDPFWIARVRAAVDLPVLRKDFLVRKRQIQEAAVLGADAVLLIQRLLDPSTLAELLAEARRLSLDVLLELFADEDPAPAVASGAEIIGVNARDLATFELDLGRVAEMAESIPADRVRVAESGIRGREDLERLHGAGYHAALIGEHLVRADDPQQAVAALLGR